MVSHSLPKWATISAQSQSILLDSQPTPKRSHQMSCYTFGTFQSQTNFSKEGLKGLVYLTEIHKQNTCTCTGNCHLNNQHKHNYSIFLLNPTLECVVTNEMREVVGLCGFMQPSSSLGSRSIMWLGKGLCMPPES